MTNPHEGPFQNFVEVAWPASFEMYFQAVTDATWSSETLYRAAWQTTDDRDGFATAFDGGSTVVFGGTSAEQFDWSLVPAMTASQEWGFWEQVMSNTPAYNELGQVITKAMRPAFGAMTLTTTDNAFFPSGAVGTPFPMAFRGLAKYSAYTTSQTITGVGGVGGGTVQWSGHASLDQNDFIFLNVPFLEGDSATTVASAVASAINGSLFSCSNSGPVISWEPASESKGAVLIASGATGTGISISTPSFDGTLVSSPTIPPFVWSTISGFDGELFKLQPPPP